MIKLQQRFHWLLHRIFQSIIFWNKDILFERPCMSIIGKLHDPAKFRVCFTPVVDLNFIFRQDLCQNPQEADSIGIYNMIVDSLLFAQCIVSLQMVIKNNIILCYSLYRIQWNRYSWCKTGHRNKNTTTNNYLHLCEPNLILEKSSGIISRQTASSLR